MTMMYIGGFTSGPALSQQLEMPCMVLLGETDIYVIDVRTGM